MKVRWLCDACGKTGTVERDEHMDFDAYIQKVKAAHKQVSHECHRSNGLGWYFAVELEKAATLR